jgi:hypothetical protein
VKKILQATELWDTDLTRLKGFEAAVLENLISFMEKGGI